MAAPAYQRASSGSILSVLVQRTVSLVPDLLLTSPVVRLHVVSAATGGYFHIGHSAISNSGSMAVPEGQQQQGLGAGGDVCLRHIVEGTLQEKLLEHPGRPSLATVGNNTSHPEAALLEHVPPIQTGPYQLQEACSNGLMAEWQQELRVDVSPDLLRRQDALLLLEVLQMPASFKKYRPLAVQQPLELHLQLYKTAAGAGAGAGAAVVQPGPESVTGEQQGLTSRHGAAKYPGSLQVVLSAQPRPAAEQMLVVTDPAAGVRPDVPAGYGTGFEHGRLPWSLLHNPHSLINTIATTGAGASCAGAAGPLSGGFSEQQQLLLEMQLHRHHATPCQVPNGLLVDMKGTSGGCSCMAFSRDGRWLAAAAADSNARISWAKDDSAIITASADYTAKVWHLPALPVPYKGSSGSIYGTAAGLGTLRAGSSSTFGSTAAAVGAAASAGVACVVLQHHCFVYAAEVHPRVAPVMVAVTGGYDGTLRVWDACQGLVLFAVQVCSCPVNCLTFNQLGSQVVAGDAAGILHEMAVDLSAVEAAAAWTAAATTCSLSRQPTSDCNGSLPRPGGGGPPLAALAPAADDVHSSGGQLPSTDTWQRDSTRPCPPSGAQLLKRLRSSSELAGCPLVSLAFHPGGHHLLALSKSKSCQLVALDAKLLLVARRFVGVRCSSAPIKAGISPDGSFVMCGSEDGSVLVWDWASATPTRLRHMELGGWPVYCTCWSSCFQAVAVCSLSPYSSIRVLCAAPLQPAVQLNPPRGGAAAAAAAARGAASQRVAAVAGVCGGGAAGGPCRVRLLGPVPEQLTPQRVHMMLEELRADAAQRGLFDEAGDDHAAGELLHLVVKSSHRNSSSSGRLQDAAEAAGGLQAPVKRQPRNRRQDVAKLQSTAPNASPTAR
eukprot:gene7429-7638_t